MYSIAAECLVNLKLPGMSFRDAFRLRFGFEAVRLEVAAGPSFPCKRARAIGQCKRRERPSAGEHPWGCVQFPSRSQEIPTRSSGGRRRRSCSQAPWCSPLSHGRPYLLRAGPRPPPAHRQPRPSRPRSTFCARPCPSISQTCPPSPQTRRARRRRPALCAELEFQRARL
jgi:hypothetical protein